MWQCGKSNFSENYFKYRTNGNKSNLHKANMILDSKACFFFKGELSRSICCGLLIDTV